MTGYDGIDVGKYYNPAITTIKQPVKEIAEKTIRLLFDIIAGRKKCEHPSAGELVVRASSGPVGRLAKEA